MEGLEGWQGLAQGYRLQLKNWQSEEIIEGSRSLRREKMGKGWPRMEPDFPDALRFTY